MKNFWKNIPFQRKDIFKCAEKFHDVQPADNFYSKMTNEIFFCKNI